MRANVSEEAGRKETLHTAGRNATNMKGMGKVLQSVKTELPHSPTIALSVAYLQPPNPTAEKTAH